MCEDFPVIPSRAKGTIGRINIHILYNLQIFDLEACHRHFFLDSMGFYTFIGPKGKGIIGKVL